MDDRPVTEFIVHVKDDDNGNAFNGLPEEVLVVQRYARGLGCDYVLLDRDAHTNEDLPT